MPGATVEFIEDVDKYMQGKQSEVELLELREQLQNCKQQEQSLMARKERLLDRQPEIKMALEAVLGLIEQQSKTDPLLVDFELTENIYAKASLQDVDSVNLWLGANVMVEYPLAEAKQLLEEQLQGCDSGLKTTAKDLEAVKNNTTITEVNLARVFNWDVEQRRKSKLAAAAAGGSS